MSDLSMARFQFAYTLIFHMIFAALGVGMPLMMIVAEGLWLRSRQERYRRLARTWAKATGILFAIGAVSGTGISFELGLLWPRFMGYAGSTIGPAFALEGFAFFMEAIFIGLYLYGWERLSPLAHWLCGLVVAISGATSSVLVTAANAWMQNPIGAELLATNPAGLDVAKALFANPDWAIMTLHSTLSCYVATAFGLVGVYAWSLLKGRNDEVRQGGLKVAIVVGFLAALTMPITGHVSARMVAAEQPAKLAAMESQFVTEQGAPLRIGGIPDVANRRVYLALEVPGGLSWLATGDWNAVVAGLDRLPPADWPNVPLVHLSFQLMVAVSGITPLVGLWYLWRVSRNREPVSRRGLLRALVIASPLGFLALEAGWMVTEVGRQPWTIYHGVMRTSSAVTPAVGLAWTLAGFVLLYLLLGSVLVALLSRLRHA